jgi:predicted transcriptional regulator
MDEATEGAEVDERAEERTSGGDGATETERTDGGTAGGATPQVGSERPTPTTADERSEAIAAVEFLARSETRVRILDALVESGPLTRDDLQRRFDAARTTVQRNLDALVEQGWVRERNREYDATQAGEWVAEDFGHLVRTVDTASELAPVYEHVDTGAVDLNLRHMDVSVTTPDPADPLKMIHEQVTHIEGAEYLRMLFPLTCAQALEALHQQVTEAGADLELVVTPAVAANLRSEADYREQVADLQAAETASLWVYEGQFPYYLGRYADTVELGLVDDGQPAALVATEDERARRWAERTVEEYRTEATPFEQW